MGLNNQNRVWNILSFNYYIGTLSNYSDRHITIGAINTLGLEVSGLSFKN